MRQIKLFLSLTALSFVCGFFLIFAGKSVAETKVLEIGCLDFPPYYSINTETKEIEGIYIEFLKQLFDSAGLKYNIVMSPATRLYNDLATGKTNIWMGTAGVEAYADKVNISPEKIVDILLQVYTTGDNPLPESKTELNGMELITIQGYNYGGFIKYIKDPANKITIIEAPSHESAFKMLNAGRAKYVLDYKEPSDKSLQAMPPIPDLKVSQIMVVPIYLNINKETPDAEGIMIKLMDSYHSLKAENKLPF